MLYISNAYLPSNKYKFLSWKKLECVYRISGLICILQHWECTFLLKNFLFEVSSRKIRKFCIIFFSPDIDLTYGSHFFSDIEENYIQTKKIFHPLVVLSILSVSAQEIIRNSFLFKLLYQLDSLWNINRNQDMERVNGHRNHPRNRLCDWPMCFSVYWVL